MSRIHRKFGRSNRSPGHGAEHPGQAKGSQRKRQRRTVKAAALAAEAAKLGITMVELRRRQQRELDAIVAAQSRQQVTSYAPRVVRSALEEYYGYYR